MQALDVLASPAFLDPTAIAGAGLIVLAAVIFAECGLLVGFFLPGDTLLFTAGILIATGEFQTSIWLVLIVLTLAAIAGNVVGYWIGYKAGPTVFNRPKSRLFKPEYVERSQSFFDRYGGFTVIVARFVPIMRTVATVMAGVSRMRYSTYVVYSVIGAVLWIWTITGGAYWLAQFDWVRKYIEPHLELIILAAVGATIIPIAVHWWMAGRAQKRGAASEPTA